MSIKFAVFIPTLNAGSSFTKILKQVEKQTLQPSEKLIIDSGSIDNTVNVGRHYGFEIRHIDKSEFTHGKVRNIATVYLHTCDFIIFMTQDVELKVDAFEQLVNYIQSEPKMAVAYGRQVSPLSESNILEKKDRSFNYPAESHIRTSADTEKYGIKTVFNSDAFAIYRRTALIDLGNFPVKVNFAEDMYMAAKAIEKGYSVGYCANSVVYHSNHLSLLQTFKRYQHIGKFHKDNPWIQEKFGRNESEGVKLVLDEWKFLLINWKPYLIPYSFMRTGVKYLGYKLPK